MLDSFSQLAFPIQALIATLFTWALTSLGACVVFFMRQPNRNVMDAMLGLAGGVMVAAAFWSLLSPSIDMSASLGMNPWLTALIGFMGGGVLLFLGDRLFTRFSERRALLRREDSGRKAGFKRCAMLVFSITLHNIPEGMAVGLACALAAGGGFYAFTKQKQKKQAEKEALDPDANYTEDKGDFEIPMENEPEETSEENNTEV